MPNSRTEHAPVGIPVNAIAVSRRQRSSNKGIRHEGRLKHDFYLRGYKHLFIVRKPERRETQLIAEHEIKVGIGATPAAPNRACGASTNERWSARPGSRHLTWLLMPCAASGTAAAQKLAVGTRECGPMKPMWTRLVTPVVSSWK